MERGYEPEVDIIIPYRNEEASLPALCTSLLGLHYPNDKFKILFIDDHSDDKSSEIIREFLEDKLNFTIISLHDVFGKKSAIKKAWEHSEAEFLVHTDGDTTMGADWLNALLKPFAKEQIQFVSGPVCYEQGKGEFLTFTQREFAALVAIGAAHIQMKLPMICNGANLAYRNSLLKDIDLLDEKASGDDVFLMRSAFKLKIPIQCFFKKMKMPWLQQKDLRLLLNL